MCFSYLGLGGNLKLLSYERGSSFRARRHGSRSSPSKIQAQTRRGYSTQGNPFVWSLKESITTNFRPEKACCRSTSLPLYSLSSIGCLLWLVFKRSCQKQVPNLLSALCICANLTSPLNWWWKLEFLQCMKLFLFYLFLFATIIILVSGMPNMRTITFIVFIFPYMYFAINMDAFSSLKPVLVSIYLTKPTTSLDQLQTLT